MAAAAVATDGMAVPANALNPRGIRKSLFSFHLIAAIVQHRPMGRETDMSLPDRTAKCPP